MDIYSRCVRRIFFAQTGSRHASGILFAGELCDVAFLSPLCAVEMVGMDVGRSCPSEISGVRRRSISDKDAVPSRVPAVPLWPQMNAEGRPM